MAVNKQSYIGSMYRGLAAEPFTIKGRFQAGATAAVKRGELLEFNGTNWVPLASDKSMAAVIGVAFEEIKDGDRAGYYRVIVPRPGDLFRFTVASAAVALGASVYWASSQSVATSGSNVLGDVVGDDHYPQFQGHTADDASPDAGTTIRATTEVTITIKQSVSYFAALQA